MRRPAAATHCHTLLIVLIVLTAASAASGQGTAITYQGHLEDDATAANGTYDLQFKLFNTQVVGTGTQQGATVTLSPVQVTGGIFTVQLDFGACATCFDGSARFLEISVKQTSGSTFTTLGPRQPLTSTPYALRSLSAASANGLSVACINCVTSSQIQSVQGSQITGNIAGSQINGAIPVASLPVGSGNYIQNTISQQASSSFNISDSGTAGGTLSANAVNTATQYNLNGLRILGPGSGNDNLFAGVLAGVSNTSNGNNNSFFGSGAGRSNTEGDDNSFFGREAGKDNTVGSFNSFIGRLAGINSTTGDLNSFFGYRAGFSNNTGDRNTLIGYESNVETPNLTNATAIGANSVVGASNSLVLGSINFVNGATASTNVGIGTRTPAHRLTIGTGTNFVTTADLAVFRPSGAFATVRDTVNDVEAVLGADGSSVGGLPGSSIYGSATNHGVQFRTNNATRMVIDRAGNLGIGTATPLERLHVVGNVMLSADLAVDNNSLFVDAGTNRVGIGTPTPADRLHVNGILRVATLGANGGTNFLCQNASDQIATCSSSIRYKHDVLNFAPGLDLVRRLRPVSFSWKEGGKRDVGLIAEEVNEVEPLLVTRNAAGEIEGVKYHLLNVVLFNAVREQQHTIEKQNQTMEKQRQAITVVSRAAEELRRTNAAQNERLRRLESAVSALSRRHAIRRPRRP